MPLKTSLVVMRYEELLPRTKHFEQCLAKHKDKAKRIEQCITRILQDPYLRSHLLGLKKGMDLRGKRSRHMNPNFVFVYVICEECIQASFREKGYNNCSFCKEMPLRRVIFLGFGTHQDIYSKEYKM